MAPPPEDGRDGRSDNPEFDWLYGGRPGSGSPSGSQSGPGPDRGTDPEPTQVLPTSPRPRSGGGSGPGGPGGSPGGPVRPVPPPREPRRPRGRGRRRFRFRWVTTLLVLWLVFLVAVPFWAWSQVAKVDATPGDQRPPEQPGTTYLLVGSDSREGLTRKEELDLGTGRAEGRRTDTMMLLHTGRGPNLLMSIPRDSIVEVPGQGTTKVNAAYALGGPKLLVRTLENETGIRIDDYVEIGFGGFVDVVDAVGGIRICPKEAMNDPEANLDIRKGCQRANGKKALGYARSRKTSSLGDIDRARNQREVVSAVGAKAASPWSVINPVRYVRLAQAGSGAVRVGEDTSMFSALRFAWAMTRVDGENGLTCGVPISDLAVNWDRERADRLFRLIAEDRTEDVGKDLCRPSGLLDQ